MLHQMNLLSLEARFIVLHKRLRLHAYKLQIVQALEPDDRPRQVDFAEEILQRIDDDNDYFKCVVFLYEASFHVSGKSISITFECGNHKILMRIVRTVEKS